VGIAAVPEGLERMKKHSVTFVLATVLMVASCSAAGHLGQDAVAVWMTLMRRLGLTSSPVALVDLSQLEIARIGPETKGVQGIYFSDFVEQENSNHIRPAARFRHTSDTLIGDKRMPLSQFSRFYGVEDGRIKAGSLNLFSDSTTVLPVRNRYYGYISRIEFNRNRNSRGWLYVRNPFQIWKERRQMRRENEELVSEGKLEPLFIKPSHIREQLPIVSYYPPDTGVIIYGTDGEVMNEPTVKEAVTGKIFLADSLGNAVFINNLPGFGPDMLEELNKKLTEHPMCPVIIDNGRYYRFTLSGASYRDYCFQDLYRPDSCLFVVGSLK
jgi:hypothetical protein